VNSGELYDTFRSDVVDEAAPYLWSEDEVYRYMDDAYTMFVRLTGGIADFTSNATQVTVTAGDGVTDLHPSLLRVMQAFRASDNREVTVVNPTDLPTLFSESDYGSVRPLMSDPQPGLPRFLVIGAQRGKARLLPIPSIDDTLNLVVYRLPLVKIVDDTHPLDEIQDEHHLHLLSWMKYHAYNKQDSETFDRTKAQEAEARFRAYCTQVKAEWERYKHKTRVVRYGGV